MNKNTIIALVIAGAVVVGGATLIFTKGSDKDSVKITNSSNGASAEVKTGSAAFIAVDACEVLTQTVADQVLGAGAEKADTSAGNASTDDISVSNCNYLKKPSTGNPLQDAKNGTTIGILARAAKTAAGADSNKSVFGAQKPAGVQDVSGYGDKAYYNPQFGQLNILKSNNWYILSLKKGIGANSKTTLDQIKPLADAVVGNLK